MKVPKWFFIQFVYIDDRKFFKRMQLFVLTKMKIVQTKFYSNEDFILVETINQEIV